MARDVKFTLCKLDLSLPPESEVGDQAMGEGGCSQVPANTQQRVKGVRKTVQT